MDAMVITARDAGLLPPEQLEVLKAWCRDHDLDPDTVERVEIHDGVIDASVIVIEDGQIQWDAEKHAAKRESRRVDVRRELPSEVVSALRL